MSSLLSNKDSLAGRPAKCEKNIFVALSLHRHKGGYHTDALWSVGECRRCVGVETILVVHSHHVL